MRRVRASIKEGRREKRNKETKGLQGGGAPRGAGLRLGRVSPGQESPVPEKQELHQPSRPERGSQRVGAGPQEGGGALRPPGTLTDTAPWGERAELPKGLQRMHALTRSSSEGLGRRLEGRGLRGGSANPPAQAGSPGCRGHSPGSGLPHDRQRPGGPRTARTLLPRAEQISGPAPEPPGPADGELRSYCGS